MLSVAVACRVTHAPAQQMSYAVVWQTLSFCLPWGMLIFIAGQFGHAPISQFAEGTTCCYTWRVVVCRPSAYSLGGASANCFAMLVIVGNEQIAPLSHGGTAGAALQQAGGG